MTTSRHLIEAASVYSVKNYGATGDNSTNDTAAIHAAIAAMPSGGTLWIPPGDYRVKACLFSKAMTVTGGGTLRNHDTSDNTTGNNYICGITAAGVTLDGINVIGAVSASATAPATYYAVLLFADGSDNPYERVRIQDCYIEGGRYNISLSEGKNCWVSGCQLVSAHESAILGPAAGDRCFVTDNVFTDTRNNAGIRIGALTDTEYCRDIIIARNAFYNCGASGPQDAIDVASANAERIHVIGNSIRDCGDGIELKVTTTGDTYTDVLIAHNVLTASSASYSAGVRLNFSAAGAQDHVERVMIANNSIYHATIASTLGILTNAHTDITISGNAVFNTAYPIYIDSEATAKIAKRVTVSGNRTTGGYGLYMDGDSGSYIDDLAVIGNHFHYKDEGIRNYSSAGVGAILRRPRIAGNVLRCTDNSGNGNGIYLTGVQGGSISGNDILALGNGIYIDGGLTNTTASISRNVIDSSDGTDGNDCIETAGASGTFQIHDNTVYPRDGYRGWVDAGGGATVLAGGNMRGVSSAIPTNAGALGDTYYDSTPAAGATKWVCTTAGGSGAAVWTAQ